MHTILQKTGDGGVASSSPNPKLVRLMTGNGRGWDDARIAYEANKFSQEYPAPGYIPSDVALTWCEAMGKGGLTEVQVFELLELRLQHEYGWFTSAIVTQENTPYHITGCGDSEHDARGGMCSDPDCHDRYFRDALVWDDSQPGKCRCDMPIARGIHMDRIRVVRNAELAAKDITFMRAVEAGDTSAQTTIGTEKQVLRDIPQTFDLTTVTPEQLKAKWPPELPARE
jgi:hypothetical protein